MNKVKIALVGCGPHARRIYLKALDRLRQRYDIEIALAVELIDAHASLITAIQAHGFSPEIVLVEPFNGQLPDSLNAKLSTLVNRLGVQGVIIATEPLVHKAYADWALSCNLHILIDKPVTARANAVTDLSSAEGILEDFDDLLHTYQRLQRRKETVFMVNAQRRVHPGFQFVEQLIGEVGQAANCPVTSLQSYHCDGQWRLPAEIVTQTYHPYCQGYGKASHSGYHIFDMMYRLYSASGTHSKLADTMEIVSSFVQPRGFIKQITEADYAHLFGENYAQVNPWSDRALRELYPDFGEIDVSGMITLKNQGDAIANLSINLLHNGFAQRTWLPPGKDLYKGNGRVKHEHHNIQQGPFQNIQIHSYQSSDRHDTTSTSDDDLGGSNHFDIYVFRNPIISKGEPALRVYKVADILGIRELASQAHLTSEAAKHYITERFIGYLAGTVSKPELPSQIEDHRTATQIMSGLYKSHILRQLGTDCVVQMPFNSSTTSMNFKEQPALSS